MKKFLFLSNINLSWVALLDSSSKILNANNDNLSEYDAEIFQHVIKPFDYLIYKGIIKDAAKNNKVKLKLL